jgi:hypothetical protein
LKIKNILRISLFLLLAYCNLSLALAINDVAITSSLGEPLIAKIHITDVEKSPDADCFSASDSSTHPAFTNPTLAIKHYADGYQLMIKSHQAITEPILNLRVAYHCDPNINRDYVVLLDPPLQNNVETSINNSTNTPNRAANPASRADIDSNTASIRQATNTTVSKKKAAPKAVKTSSIDEKLTAIYTGRPQATANTNNPEVPIVKSKPYLSISGGSSGLGEALTLPNPALRLETQIDLSRAEENLPLSATDVMDEITAMDNRLTLLRTQIISLQDKNEKLRNEAENAKKQLENSKTTLRIAAGLIALLALLVFVVWLRRKLIKERLTKVENNWLDNSDLANTPDQFAAPITNSGDKQPADTKNSNFNDAFDENAPYDITSSFNAQPAYTTLATSINSNAKEDILESADVLTEYGRYGLAIHLLQDYLADHPSESPKVWLKLLSLIAAHGTEAEYAKAVADCNHFYHIHMPNFAEARKAGSATIEDFPYITRELEMAWGTASAVTLLNDLIYNRASQPEDGFEPEIFEQLFLLKLIAENLNADSASAISQTAAGFTSGPVNEVDETSSDESAKSIDDAAPQNLSAPDTFPAINFDDYATQHNPVEMLTGNTKFEAATLPSLAGNNALSEIKPTLDAPEIDFPQQIKEVADTQNSTTAVVSEKPQKRIMKDSNLIDWVLTDES